MTTVSTLQIDVGELPSVEGATLGPSPWLEVTQERIDGFAASVDDEQWIHTDPVRAARGPYETTIAHGFLTLTLVIRLWSDVVSVEGAAAVVNYGVDRVRFPAPVPAGSRIRAVFRIDRVEQRQAGLQLTTTATVEVEDGPKPACVAELILLYLRP